VRADRWGQDAGLSKLRLPPNNDSNAALVFFDVTLVGAVSLSSAGPVAVTCGDVGAGDTGFTFSTHTMTAVHGDSVSVQ
jgi:hypothetical protein